MRPWGRKKLKEGKTVNAILQLLAAAACALVGALTYGATGAALGAIGGYLVTVMGTNGLRRWTPGRTILMNGRDRKQIEDAMHMATAVAWGLRPLALTEDGIARRIGDVVLDQLVEPFTVEITPYVQELHRHLLTVVYGGVKPEQSFRHVRRKYGPKMFGRRDQEVLPLLADRLLGIQAEWGSILESRVWFERWCDEVGLRGQGEARWLSHFGEDFQTLDEWKAARRQAGIDSYFADDEIALGLQDG